MAAKLGMWLLDVAHRDARIPNSAPRGVQEACGVLACVILDEFDHCIWERPAVG